VAAGAARPLQRLSRATKEMAERQRVRREEAPLGQQAQVEGVAGRLWLLGGAEVAQHVVQM